jgi:hypothetical protein
MNTHKKIIVSIGALLVAVLFFFGGMKYGEMHAVITMPAQSSRGQGGGRNGGMRNGNGGFISGDILSKDSMSITIALQNGGSKTVYTSGSTIVLKSVAGALNDLAVGQTVSVQGSVNADSSLTAQSVQIRPVGMRRGTTTPQQLQ